MVWHMWDDKWLHEGWRGLTRKRKKIKNVNDASCRFHWFYCVSKIAEAFFQLLNSNSWYCIRNSSKWHVKMSEYFINPTIRVWWSAMHKNFITSHQTLQKKEWKLSQISWYTFREPALFQIPQTCMSFYSVPAS